MCVSTSSVHLFFSTSSSTDTRLDTSAAVIDFSQPRGKKKKQKQPSSVNPFILFFSLSSSVRNVIIIIKKKKPTNKFPPWLVCSLPFDRRFCWEAVTAARNRKCQWWRRRVARREPLRILHATIMCLEPGNKSRANGALRRRSSTWNDSILLPSSPSSLRPPPQSWWDVSFHLNTSDGGEIDAACQ